MIRFQKKYCPRLTRTVPCFVLKSIVEDHHLAVFPASRFRAHTQLTITLRNPQRQVQRQFDIGTAKVRRNMSARVERRQEKLETVELLRAKTIGDCFDRRDL